MARCQGSLVQTPCASISLTVCAWQRQRCGTVAKTSNCTVYHQEIHPHKLTEDGLDRIN